MNVKPRFKGKKLMPRHNKNKIVKGVSGTPQFATSGEITSTIPAGGLTFRISYEKSNEFQYDVIHARIDNPEMTRKEAEEYCLALHKLTGETNEDD